MPLLVATQGTPEWEAAHVGRVSASVAAACLHLNPHMSRAEAWRRCMGTQKRTSNRFTEWGQNMEDVARRHYEIETGNLAEKTGLWVHPEHDWLCASPDSLIDDGLGEIKCPGELRTSVPVHYRIQILVQLIVTGRAWCDYYEWTPTGSFLERVYLQGAVGLVNRLKRFYETYVVAGVEPERKRPRRRKAS